MLIASALVFVVILASMSLDTVAREFFESSRRKAEIVNEAFFVMEHIAKSVKDTIGFQDDEGYQMTGTYAFRIDTADTLGDYTDDRIAAYSYNLPGFNGLWYNAGTPTGYNLTRNRVIAFSMTPLLDDDGLTYGVNVELTIQYDPTNPSSSQRDNPTYRMESSFFFPMSSAS